MSASYFDLYFRGQLLEGFTAEAVSHDLARLFKTDETHIARYFNGTTEVIKLNVAQVTVPRYQTAMRAIGAELIVVPAGSEPPALAPQPVTVGPAEGVTLSLADAGAEPLATKPADTPIVPVSTLSLADPDQPLPANAEASAAPPKPDTRHLSLE